MKSINLLNVVKITALVLCAAFLITAATVSAFDESGFTSGINTAAAMASLPPDTVMLRSGEFVVDWGAFYFYLHNTVSQVTYGFQEQMDWSEPSPYGGTWADLIKDYVIDQAKQSLVYDYAVDLLDISFTDYELESLKSIIDMMLAEAESLESLERDLRLDGFYSLAVYEGLFMDYAIQEKVPVALYGEYYDDISDEAAADYAERNGFMRAKHILLSFPSEYDGFTLDEIEAAKPDVYKQMQDILAELNKRKNDADFEDFFVELMTEHSEDPGSFNFPDGYLFQFYDMVEPFSAACEALEPGGLSGIVETSYGYHIILRLPLDYDNMVPYSLMSQGQYYSLRQLAVFEAYEAQLFEWLDAMVVEHSPELDALDIAELFAWHD